MQFLNEKVILMPEGVEVPLIFLMDNLRERVLTYNGKYKKYKGGWGGMG